MLVNLTWLYFKKQKRRTVFTTFVLSMGLVIILVSFQLVNGFENEINSVISQYDRQSKIYYVTRLDNSLTTKNIFELSLTHLEYQSLNNILINNSEFLTYWHWFYSNFYDVQYYDKIKNEFRTSEVQIVITDPLKLQNNRLITPESVIKSNDSMIGLSLFSVMKNFQNLTVLENFSNSNAFSFSEIEISNPVVFQSNLEFSSSIIIPLNYFQVKPLPNKLLISINNEDQVNRVKSIFNQNGYDIISISGNFEFLAEGANQMIEILLLLQIVMSVLIIISIANILIELFEDLQEDFKIILHIGFDYTFLTKFMFGISILIGIFAGFIAIIISFLISNLVLSLISATGYFTFIIVSIEYTKLVATLLYSTIVSCIATLYPVLKVQKYV
jgi:ABC-type lipoprotein release transport system permease subunit